MRSRNLHIKFPEELVQKADKFAKALYISRAAFIREAVAEKLNRENEINKVEEFDWEKLLDKED